MRIIVLFFGSCLISVTGFSQQPDKLSIARYRVLGACEMCKDRIESVLKIPGVAYSRWNAETNLLYVAFDSTRTGRVQMLRKISDAGHDNELFIAANKTYNRLPACCHYDRDTVALRIPDTAANLSTPIRTIPGLVRGSFPDGREIPLVNATLTLLSDESATLTDTSGRFLLVSEVPDALVVSHAGFKTDTISLDNPHPLVVTLKSDGSSTLAEVMVRSRQQTAFVPTRSVLNTLNIGTRELAKAACCNLSESFETTPSVDVAYSDAATGVRQIQLLGLSGSYAQLLMENMPEARGLSGSYGLTFIPGPWVSGLQVTKGTGSVVNGYESISGQINVDEVKPLTMDRLYVNAYTGSMGRLESSVNLSQKLNERWATALLLHANGVVRKNDMNGDGFLDMPVGRQLNLINRWQYTGSGGLRAQFAVKWLSDNRQAGELTFDPKTDKLGTSHYGVGVAVNQGVLSGKIGYVFPGKPYKSIGLMLSAMQYSNDAYYGIRPYDARQHSVYANLIYQSIIGSTLNEFKTGISFMNDRYNEQFNGLNFSRRETVPGVFAEYTCTAISSLTIVAGIRGDYHNRFGFFATPRLHLKYDIASGTVLRFSGGSGFRMANVFAENTGALVSSRSIQLPFQGSDAYGYGLQPERAWNFGFGLVQRFRLNNRSGTIGLDAYRTTFRSQTVADYDFNPQTLLLYNLDGRSFSNSLQAEINAEPLEKLSVRLAYRWLDVRTTYNGKLLEKPLVARHRAFINLAYETSSNWLFDFTLQWLGRKRLPNTSFNPSDKQLGDYSPSYVLINAQVTRHFGERWEVYAGAENIGNYMQQRLFISPEQPFGPYFDGSIVWGPVNGRNIYAGLRYKIGSSK